MRNCNYLQVSKAVKMPQHCCWTQVRVSEAQWSQRDWRVEFGTEQGLLQGQARRTEQAAHAQKSPSSKKLDGFWGRVLTGKIWGEGCRVCDLPLVGWWWGNRVGFQESQSSAFMFQSVWGLCPRLSLKLSSSTWVGALVPVEECRDVYQIVTYIPWRGYAFRLFLLFLHSPN